MRCNACYCYALWLSSPITQVFVTAWPGLNTWSEALLEHLLFRYARKNLVVVNIYIKVSHSEHLNTPLSQPCPQDPFVTRILRDQKVSRIEFVANTGGLLGLCTGFSFVTFCEIIYQVRSGQVSPRLTDSCRSPSGSSDTSGSFGTKHRLSDRDRTSDSLWEGRRYEGKWYRRS